MPGIRAGASTQLGPWIGGVRYDKPTELLLPDELATTVNCRVGVAGQVEKRKGSASFNGEDALESGATVTACGEFANASNVTYKFMFIKDKY